MHHAQLEDHIHAEGSEAHDQFATSNGRATRVDTKKTTDENSLLRGGVRLAVLVAHELAELVVREQWQPVR